MNRIGVEERWRRKAAANKTFTLPRPTLRPNHIALRTPQGFAPAGGRVMNHQRVGPKEKIKRGQIKLTDAVFEAVEAGIHGGFESSCGAMHTGEP